MSWQPHQVNLGGQPLPAPEDGIVAKGTGSGTVGRSWERLMKGASKESKDRVLRGRNYARLGRARALHIAPGSATAEVVSDDTYHPSLRVRPFNRGEWTQLARRLAANLDSITSLMEGELPLELIEQERKFGLSLLPRWDELSFDCDCGDYIMPCTHVATVFHVLTDALDGDPFLLLTLRGRTREHLMATLRSYWGDDRAIQDTVRDAEAPPPDGDWFSSPAPLPEFACSVEMRPTPAAGLRALGPPPSGSDLFGTLTPLYEAGGRAAAEAVEAVPDREPRRRRAATRWTEPVVEHVASAPPQPAPEPEPEVDLTEVLIDHLAEYDGSATGAIAAALGLTEARVYSEMLELAELGIVTTSEARDVWWLG